jgi:hypothetical protein
MNVVNDRFDDGTIVLTLHVVALRSERFGRLTIRILADFRAEIRIASRTCISAIAASAERLARQRQPREAQLRKASLPRNAGQARQRAQQVLLALLEAQRAAQSATQQQRSGKGRNSKRRK